ncbi:MAG: SEL1-like repeat protein [Alphaproteobacteria bacterium]
MHRLAFAFAVLATVVVASPASAGLAEGLWAYERGDWAVARRELWRPAALEGSAEARYVLGLIHRDGKGVAADATEAIKWLRMAAALGEGRAMLALGRAHERGELARHDETKALAWYTLAAAHLAVGVERDAALRGEDRIARLAPAWQRKKAAKLAESWGADLAKTAMVVEIQDGLASFGYPVGPVDGIVGPKTRGAITSYQKKNALAVTGEASEELRAHVLAARLAMPD